MLPSTPSCPSLITALLTALLSGAQLCDSGKVTEPVSAVVFSSLIQS